MSAINSIVLIYKYRVVYTNISPRNFLIANDLLIYLCDFSRSTIGEYKALV